MKLERRQKKKIVPKSAGRVATMNTALHWRGGGVVMNYQNTVHMIKIDTIVEVIVCTYNPQLSIMDSTMMVNFGCRGNKR